MMWQKLYSSLAIESDRKAEANAGKGRAEPHQQSLNPKAGAEPAWW